MALEVVVACTSPDAPLRVFAAAGTKPAIDEAVELFRRQQDIGIEVSYGGGGEVLARMVMVEAGDVYIAPEEQFMESAVCQGAVDPTTIRDLAWLVPVLAVPKGNPERVSGLSDLARPGLRLGVTRPETTVLGRYAPEIFRRSDLKKTIEGNVVTEAPRPDLLVTWLVMGKLDVAITWHIYRVTVPGEIEVIPLAPEDLPGVGKMRVAVATYSSHPELARRFIQFLISADGQAIFERHGYIVDVEELKEYWPDG